MPDFNKKVRSREVNFDFTGLRQLNPVKSIQKFL